MAEPNTNKENPDDGGTEVEETEPIQLTEYLKVRTARVDL